MVQPVMERTQAHQVGGNGEPAVFAVDDVVDVQPPALATTGEATPAVAVLNVGAHAVVDGLGRR
jgi:hypothetical protein